LKIWPSSVGLDSLRSDLVQFKTLREHVLTSYVQLVSLYAGVSMMF